MIYSIPRFTTFIRPIKTVKHHHHLHQQQYLDDTTVFGDIDEWIRRQGIQFNASFHQKLGRPRTHIWVKRKISNLWIRNDSLQWDGTSVWKKVNKIETESWTKNYLFCLGLLIDDHLHGPERILSNQRRCRRCTVTSPGCDSEVFGNCVLMAIFSVIWALLDPHLGRDIRISIRRSKSDSVLERAPFFASWKWK